MILRKNRKAIPCPFCESTEIMESITRDNKVTAITCACCKNDVTLQHMSHIKTKSTYERVNQVIEIKPVKASDYSDYPTSSEVARYRANQIVVNSQLFGKLKVDERS